VGPLGLKKGGARGELTGEVEVAVARRRAPAAEPRQEARTEGQRGAHSAGGRGKGERERR
jgi:hypothetical protein